MRFCTITDGSIETGTGAGDGAYDLHDVCGTPADIGKAIAESLAECDIFQGGRGLRSCLERDGEIFLNLRIRIAKERDEQPVSDTPAVCGQL